MKLVIDIDEKDYEYIKELGLNGYRDQTNRVVEAIANGTSLEEELENIKEKINSEDVNCQYEDDYVYSSGLQKAIEIIDNHIEELKGETE